MKKGELSNFILSVTGASVSQLGSLIYTFAIGLYVLKITGSGQSFGITLMMGTLPRVILGPFAGNWADRLNRKVMVVLSDFFSGILMLGIYIYCLNGELSLSIIYGAAFMLAVSATFLESAFGAASVEIVSTESLTRFGAVRHTFRSLIDLFAPIIGGLVYALVPISFFLLANGVSFLLSAISEMFIDFKFNPMVDEEKPKASFFSDFKEGFSYFFKDKGIQNIAFLALFLNFFLISVAVVLPFGLINVKGVSEQLYGVVMAVASVGSLAGALLVGKLNSQFSKKHLVKWLSIMSLAFVGVGFMLHSFVDNIIFIVGGVSLFGFILSGSATAVNIPVGVHLQKSVDPAYLGRIFSILGTLASGITPLAFLFFGFLTGHLSPFVILVSSGVITLGIVLVQHLNKDLNQYDSVEAESEA